MHGKALEGDKQFELVLWLIERYDRVRGAIANRAALVLSADTIVVTATALLLDRILSSLGTFSLTERVIVFLSIGATFVLLAISMYFATTAVANVWRRSRDLLAPNGPKREFFYPRETLEGTNRNYQSFAEAFTSASYDQVSDYALGELWSVINSSFTRYQKLRTAIRFTIFSFIPFFFTVLVFLLQVV